MASGADFERMMRNSTQEQRSKGMEAWMKWMNDNKASILEGGAPLGKTRRADAVDVSDTKNNIGGYSIVQAETHDAVAKLFGRVYPTSSNAGCMGGNSRNHAAAGNVIHRCSGCYPTEKEIERRAAPASTDATGAATRRLVVLTPCPLTRSPSALRSLMNFAPFFPFDERRVRHHRRRGGELPPARPRACPQLPDSQSSDCVIHEGSA